MIDILLINVYNFGALTITCNDVTMYSSPYIMDTGYGYGYLAMSDGIIISQTDLWFVCDLLTFIGTRIEV